MDYELNSGIFCRETVRLSRSGLFVLLYVRFGGVLKFFGEEKVKIELVTSD